MNAPNDPKQPPQPRGEHTQGTGGGEMSNITQADIDRAMEIINTPFGGNRGIAILSKSNYMYLCGMVQAMTKRIAELEKPILCAKCNDHIIADDGAVCEICADTMDTIITELQTRIAELKAYKFALENAIIDRTLGGNTPLAQYVAEAIAELNRQAQEEKC
jgi:hypothetical protein